MEELWNQMRELVSRYELQVKREEMARNNSARDMQFQQSFYRSVQPNSYPQNHYYYPAQDQVHYQNSDFVPDFQNSAYGDAYPDFQQEDQFLDYKPWPNADSHIFSRGAGTSWRNLDAVVEDNKEEEENAFAMADKAEAEALELSQEAEKLEIGTSAEKFRFGEELKEVEEKEVDYHSYPLFRIGEKVFTDPTCEGAIFLQSVHDQHGEEGEVDQNKAELELPLQSAQDIYGRVQQKEEEEKEKEEEEKLDALNDLTLLEVREEATIDGLPCENLDSLLQEVQNLLQHGLSSKGEGEKKQLSPNSIRMLRITEKGVEGFTRSYFDALSLEESRTMAAQNQLHDEKQEEEATTPSLLEMKAAEPLYPQSTTPMHQEEEAVHSFKSENLPFDFKLTSNQFLLVVNELVSGGELHKKQLNLSQFCKLQPKALYGEVCKKGTHGDGVPWFIKVHPP